MNSTKLLAAACVSFVALSACPALAQSSDATGGITTTNKVIQTEGEAIYNTVCQGCHMPDGVGANGAGSYPKLAKNENLEAGGYPIYVIVNGQKAMPSLGGDLSDDQVAAVVNYIRSHFGNNYTDTVTAEEVKATRP